MFYDKNRQALAAQAKHLPALAMLDVTQPAADVMLQVTPVGDYTLVVKNIALHDPSGAGAEVTAVCNAQYKPGPNAHHLIFGVGLGYLLQDVCKRNSGQIYLYEPDLPLLRFVLDNVDLSEYLSKNNVTLCLTPQQLLCAFDGFYINADPLSLLYLPGYAQLWGDELTRLIKQDIGSVILAKHNTMVAMRAYQSEWVQHFFANMAYFPKTKPFTPLNNYFEKKPALVISSGPSLERCMNDVKKLSNQSVLIAVGGALRPLLAAGVVPDFAVFLDYQGPEKQLFGLTDQLSGVSMILGPFAHGLCYQTNSAHCFQPFLNNYTDFSLFLEENLGSNQPRFTSGPTVSILALQAAVAMGCHPIALIGQDLAVSDTKVYAGGPVGKLDDDGFLSFEENDTQLAQRYQLFDVPGREGDTVKTTQDYRVYIGDFTEYVRRYQLENPASQRRFINSSLGGAQIDGFDNLALAELAHHFALQPLDKTLPQNLQTLGVDPEQHQRFQKSLKQLMQTTSQLIDDAKQVVLHLEKLMRQPDDNTHRKYATIHQRFMKTLFSQTVLCYVLQLELWSLRRMGEAPDVNPFQMNHGFYNACLRNLESVLPVMQASLTQLSQKAVV